MAATAQGPIELRPIGHVASPLTERAQAPKQGDEGAPEAWPQLDGARLRVRALEAIDGTPILDVKPVLRRVGER